jgi:hypothetical protein
MVATEAERAGERAESPAQQVRHHADCWRRAAWGSQPKRSRGGENGFPGASRADAHGLGRGVDLDRVHGPQRDRETAADLAEPTVSRAEDRDWLSTVDGDRDRRCDLTRRPRIDDHVGRNGYSEVEPGDSIVIAVVSGLEHRWHTGLSQRGRCVP